MHLKTIALTGLVAVIAAVPVVAIADDPPGGVTTAIHPKYLSNKAGVGSLVDFNVVVTPAPGEEYPPPGKHALIHLPKGQFVDYKPFSGKGETCSRETILTRGPTACPQKSKIGSGIAHIGTRLGNQPVREAATVDAYAGPPQGGKPVLNFYADGRSPISAQFVLQGVLRKDKAPYGEYLDVDIPRIPTTPGSPDASIMDFTVRVGAQKKVKVKKGGKTTTVTKYLITTPKTCSKSLSWAGDFTFTDGRESSASTTTACPKGSKR